MKFLSTCVSSRLLDRETRELLGLSDLQLMEKASLRIWDALRPRLPVPNPRIVAVSGKGDNGGDALALLRHAFCSGMQDLSAIVSSRKQGESTTLQARSLEAAGIRLISWSAENIADIEAALLSADVVLDGIAGTGMKGSAADEMRDMIRAVNSAKVKKPSLFIAAIDLPSGLSDLWQPAWETVRADATLALEPVKSICYDPEARMFCGDILAVGDVFPENLVRGIADAALLGEEHLYVNTSKVSGRDYKMSRGRVSIFAGSESSIGAAVLCAKAASAAGAGYVTLHVDAGIHAKVAETLESFIVKPLDPEDPLHEPCDTVLVGPGWGRGKDRAAVLKSILGKGLPTILDADALRLLAGNPELHSLIRGHAVLTPHPGELGALLNVSHPKDRGFLEVLAGLSADLQAVVIAKSHVTWIFDPEGKSSVWDGMQPELGTSGTGDVLAGLVAGCSAGSFARRPDRGSSAGKDGVIGILFAASVRAVAIHGTAGRDTASGKGWFEAADLIPACARIARDSMRNMKPQS